MNPNQEYVFGKQSDNELNQISSGKQIENPQEEPGSPIPDKPTFPGQPDKNPIPASPEPGIDEPKKDDPTRIDEEPPIFNYY